MTPEAVYARAMVCGWTPGQALFTPHDKAVRMLTVPMRKTRQQRRHALRAAIKAGRRAPVTGEGSQPAYR